MKIEERIVDSISVEQQYTEYEKRVGERDCVGLRKHVEYEVSFDGKRYFRTNGDVVQFTVPSVKMLYIKRINALLKGFNVNKRLVLTDDRRVALEDMETHAFKEVIIGQMYEEVANV